MDQGCHAETTQLTAHAATLHGRVSAVCGHAVPPAAGAVATERARFCAPLPQLLVHAVHGPNADMAQSTGQAWRLHQRISCDCGHADPP